MANYIFSYDLNGPKPTHAEMDKHIKAGGWACGRVLETVWYVGTDQTASEVVDYLMEIMSGNDSYLLATCSDLSFDHLLVTEASLQTAWANHA